MTPPLGGDTCYGRGTLVPHVGTSGGTPQGGSGGRGSTALVRATTGGVTSGWKASATRRASWPTSDRRARATAGARGSCARGWGGRLGGRSGGVCAWALLAICPT